MLCHYTWTTGSEQQGQTEISDPGQISDCLIWCARMIILKRLIPGNSNIHVIDFSDVTNLTLLHHTSFDGFAITDVEYCGGYVFASMDNKEDTENGMVKVFRGYNATTDQIELLHNITGMED